MPLTHVQADALLGGCNCDETPTAINLLPSPRSYASRITPFQSSFGVHGFRQRRPHRQWRARGS